MMFAIVYEAETNVFIRTGWTINIAAMKISAICISLLRHIAPYKHYDMIVKTTGGVCDMGEIGIDVHLLT